MSNIANGADDTNAAGWLEALDGFELWLRQSRRRVEIANDFAMALLMLPMLFSQYWYRWYVLVGLFLFWLVMRLWRWRRVLTSPSPPPVPAHLHKLLDQLTSSDLAQCIASGEIDGSEPRPYVSPKLRWLVPALPPGGRVQLLQRVMTWLEWYLGPPRNGFSQYWTSLAQFSGLPLMMVLIGFFTPDHWNIVRGVFCWTFFAFLVDRKYQEEATVFIRYLRQAWAATPAVEAAPEMAAAAIESASQLALTRQTPLIVNQAQQDLERAVAMLAVLPMAIYLFGIIPLMLPHYSLLLWMILPGSLGVICASASHWRICAPYRARLRGQLEASMLAARLAAGECSSRQLGEYAPWGLRNLLAFPAPPKAYADELRRQLWNVAFNLDWYLGPPRRLLRAHWLARPAMLAWALAGMAYFAITGAAALPHASSAALNAVEISYLAVLAALSIPATLYAARAGCWSAELCAYLRRCGSDGL